MRPPLWKYWLSYLYDLPIDDAPSLINPHLFVTLSKGRYQLTTSNAVYSYADLYGNFVKTFAELRWDLLPGNALLLLGLGLGSIPYMLERKFNLQFTYTAVEIDEEVIYLVSKYVLDELESPVTIFHADAVSFIHENSRQWDLICVDLFIDDVIPAGAMDTSFIEGLKAAVTDGGVLLYNTLARTKEDVAKSQKFLDDVFLSVFPEGGYLDVGGNWILLNDKRYVQPLQS